MHTMLEKQYFCLDSASCRWDTKNYNYISKRRYLPTVHFLPSQFVKNLPMSICLPWIKKVEVTKLWSGHSPPNYIMYQVWSKYVIRFNRYKLLYEKFPALVLSWLKDRVMKTVRLWRYNVNVKVSNSLIAVGAVEVRVPLYLGLSKWNAEPSLSFNCPFPSLIQKRYPFTAGLTKRVSSLQMAKPNLELKTSSDFLRHNEAALTTQQLHLSGLWRDLYV